MRRALILYTHGIGDVIMLTPHLRQLYKDGYICDLMCFDSIRKSHLLDECPYTDKLFDTANPHISPKGFAQEYSDSIALWQERAKDYDEAFMARHPYDLCNMGIHKIDINSKEFGFKPDDEHLEVFLTKEIENEVANNISWDYILVHTYIKEHDWHTWDAAEYLAQDKFRGMSIIDTGYAGDYYMWKEDINYTLALLKFASARILSSSFMVHACEAMNLEMDVINYGKPDRKVWPKDQTLVKNIREAGSWIKKED